MPHGSGPKANRVVLPQGLSDENVHFTHTAAVIEAMGKKDKPYTLQVYCAGEGEVGVGKIRKSSSRAS